MSHRLRMAGVVLAAAPVLFLSGCGTQPTLAAGERGAATDTPAEVPATSRALAALVLRHVDADPTYAFSGDISGRIPDLTSAAVWFTGRPGHLPEGDGPDVLELFVLPADAPFAERIRKAGPDGKRVTLADGAVMHIAVGRPQGADWGTPKGTTSHVLVQVERADELVVLEYHGAAIRAAGRSPDGRLDVVTIEQIASDPLLGLETSPDLIREGDQIKTWSDGS